MKEEKKVPKLRFPEFKGSIPVKSLENYIELISGFAFKGEDISEDKNGIPILRGVNITEGYIRHSEDMDRFFAGSIEGLERFLLSEGDLVLGMDGSKVGKNVAIISQKDEGSILIQRVARLRAKENANINYIYQHIFSSRFHRYVDVVNTSSGIPHISSKQIKDFKIPFPTLPEQTKIANFLTAVDAKIANLSEEKSLLENYKKGVMQKLFNGKWKTENGKLQFVPPSLRFKQDDGSDFPEWETKRLGEITNVITKGTTPMSLGFNYQDSGINFIKAENLTSYYTIDIDSTPKISSECDEKLKRSRIEADDILFSIAGTLGRTAIVTVKDLPANTNQALAILRLKSGTNVHYVNYALNTQSVAKVTSQILSVGAQPNLSLSQLDKFKINFPCFTEQTKIANFLTSIDEKINTATEAIEKAQEWKKGLLQQLFI